MTIFLNGEPVEMADNATVSDLAEKLGLRPVGTAVAVNGRVVRRADWALTALAANDKVMVINAAYGG